MLNWDSAWATSTKAAPANLIKLTDCVLLYCHVADRSVTLPQYIFLYLTASMRADVLYISLVPRTFVCIYMRITLSLLFSFVLRHYVKKQVFLKPMLVYI